MKKIVLFIVTVTLLLSSVSTAFAKNGGLDHQNKHKDKNQGWNDWNYNEKDQEWNEWNDWKSTKKDKVGEKTFLIKNLTLLSYGKYKIPKNVIEEGMDSAVTLDNAKGILTVTGDSNKIIIDYCKKTITVNSVNVKEPNVFKVKHNKNMKALLDYLGKQLGYKITYTKDRITVKGLNKEDKDGGIPGTTKGKITITPVGTSVVANTLNATTQCFIATAAITAGKAAGGYAVLYVGDTAVAIDNAITAADTSVDFTTSDGTPTNAELQAMVPKGGTVSVKLFNSGNTLINTITSDKALTVDYIAPTITSVVSAVYSASNSTITISVTGAGAVNDKVDVKKISLYDTALNKTYQLTDSTGVVSSNTVITIKLSAADKLALTSYGTSGVYMYIAAGSLISDTAGNTSAAFSSIQPITVIFNNVPNTTQGAITITPVGTSVVANTLNATTQCFIATAAITAGKYTGGYAILYVGDTVVAIDNAITATDTTVNFTTSDGTPTNAELQAMVPKGGTVSVKLYNSGYTLINTITSDKALTVDYIAPTIASVVSAVYSASNSTITISVTGAGAVNDKVDVKKISLYDTALNKTYQLTDSTGVVSSNTAITIKLSAADKLALTSYGTSGVYMYIAAGSLISDTAGNTSAAFSSIQPITVTFNNVPNTTQGAITITPVGTSVVANTLNATTQCFIATAAITAGKYTGGYAVLYVGDTVVAIDNAITATDTTVNFTTSDGTPTNAELQALVPKGGTVSMKLYNSGYTLINTITSDKALTVDYIAPTIASAVSAVYNVSNSTITISVTGAGTINDKVDVKKITLYNPALNKTYQLTDSTGVVSSTIAITIKLSAADKLALASYETTGVYMYIAAGALISDTAGNAAAGFAVTQLVPVMVTKN